MLLWCLYILYLSFSLSLSFSLLPLSLSHTHNTPFQPLVFLSPFPSLIHTVVHSPTIILTPHTFLHPLYHPPPLLFPFLVHPSTLPFSQSLNPPNHSMILLTTFHSSLSICHLVQSTVLPHTPTSPHLPSLRSALPNTCTVTHSLRCSQSGCRTTTLTQY